jgi:hypothetical protein
MPAKAPTTHIMMESHAYEKGMDAVTITIIVEVIVE